MAAGDDEVELCENFADLYQSEVLEIVTFVDPRVAIEQSRVSPPDLLFIDYRLPGVTGDEVAVEFSPDIPKILVTGDLAIKLDYKFERVLNKPYKRKEIEQIIEEFSGGQLSNGAKTES